MKEDVFVTFWRIDEKLGFSQTVVGNGLKEIAGPWFEEWFKKLVSDDFKLEDKLYNDGAMKISSRIYFPLMYLLTYFLSSGLEFHSYLHFFSNLGSGHGFHIYCLSFFIFDFKFLTHINNMIIKKKNGPRNFILVLSNLETDPGDGPTVIKDDDLKILVQYDVFVTFGRIDEKLVFNETVVGDGLKRLQALGSRNGSRNLFPMISSLKIDPETIDLK